MRQFFNIVLLSFIALLVNGCGVKTQYSLKEGLPTSAKTFQVDLFQNNANAQFGSTIYPGLSRDFTQSLQNLIKNQTRLDLKPEKADLVFKGEITSYKVSPTSASADQNAGQNRLTIEINVRFLNTVEINKNYERQFSFFYDYDSNELLSTVREEAHQIIFQAINQDIFNASLGSW